MRPLFVHHDGALGDLLLSLPALARLKERSGPLHLAGRPDAAGLLKELGFVAEAYDSGGSLFSSLHTRQLAPATREFLSGFGQASVFTKNPSGELARNIATVVPGAGAVLTIPPEEDAAHVALFRLRRVEACLGLEPREPPLPLLEVPALYKESARALLARAGCSDGRPLRALHPGSGGERKRWPLESYFELIGRLRKEGSPFFVVLSGPAEEGTLATALRGYAAGRADVLYAESPALSLVAALLSLCAVYVGNDSGITHLAAAVGTPTVAIFGPTDPLRWRPYGARTRVVLSEQTCLKGLGVEGVLRAVQESLEPGAEADA